MPARIGPVEPFDAEPMRPSGIVDRLVADLEPVRARRAWHDLLALVVLALVELALVTVTLPPRHDMPLAMTGPMFWWKLASCVAVAVVGTVALVAALAPDSSRRAGRRLVVGGVALVLITGLALVLTRPMPEAMAMTGDWREGLACIAVIEMLALPLLIGAMYLARRAAPAYPRAALLSAGIASAGWGAVGFAWSCPHDEPMYVLVWFGLAVLVNAGFAMLVLPRWLRW